MTDVTLQKYPIKIQIPIVELQKFWQHVKHNAKKARLVALQKVVGMSIMQGKTNPISLESINVLGLAKHC